MSVARAEDRLSRLLVMLPWLMEQGEVPLAEVADRFAMSEQELVRDLELVAMCGLPPYVDEMVDVFVDDGLVYVGVPRLFRRPLRLTAPEAFSLLAAARTALELPGAADDDALARGLDRVADALRDVGLLADSETSESSESGDDAPTGGLAIDLDRPALADEVTEAVATGAELRITYFSPSRDAVTDRTIVPTHVFVDRGNWYVQAVDHVSGEDRTFRVDRIESMAPTGVTVETDGASAEPIRFFADTDVPRVVLRLAPAATWVVDRYPIDATAPGPPLADGRASLDVTLPMSSEWWLARLLVRLGPDAEVLAVVDVDTDGADVSAAAARLAASILDGYRS
ncbi:MAG: WYL domain-containing protein [Actinomycetota bacterium]